MKRKSSLIISILFAATFLSCTNSFAQTRTFFLSQLNSITTDTFSINLSATNFTQIEDFQFSIDWDTTVITYVGYKIPVTALALNASFMNFTTRGVGILWYDLSLVGVTVPDSTIILTLNFVFRNGYKSGIIQPLWFGSRPTAIGTVDTTDGIFSAPGSVPVTFVNGYVSSAKSVIPTIAVNGNIYTAVTIGATPVAYQWYRLSGTPPVYNPIAGATASTYNYNGVPGNYVVVATFANGDKDTSAQLLPLKLLGFKGAYSNRANVLNWITSNEINMADFIVERSNDGITFNPIGKIAAISNQNPQKTYNYADADLNANFTFYYRIRMVDNNGSYTYSSIIKLNKAGKTIFQIQPNPIENSTVKVYGNNMKMAMIYDSNGKLILSQQIANPQQAILKLNNTAKGYYILNIIAADNQSQTEQFMVK